MINLVCKSNKNKMQSWEYFLTELFEFEFMCNLVSIKYELLITYHKKKQIKYRNPHKTQKPHTAYENPQITKRKLNDINNKQAARIL